MKKLLLKLLMCSTFLIYGTSNLNAQTFTFDSDLQGFTENFGPNGIVTWDSDGGAGALKLERSSNNANFGRSDGGGVDADATKFIKIVIKNMTKGITLRVGARGEDNAAGNKDFGGVLTANSSSYAVVYLDMTGEAFWNGNLTNLWFAVRQNFAGPDGDGAFINSIELLSSLPADEYSEFLKNPDFEDTSGITHFSGNQNEITRQVTGDEAQNGSQSLKLTTVAPQTKPNWVFTSFYESYSPAVPATSEITVKIWVKSNRTSPASLFARLRLNHSSGSGVNVDDTQLTSGTPGVWEELTFTYITPTGVDADELGLWFTFNWEAGDPNGVNLVNGDVVYLDNMTASIGEVTLNTKENTLRGVSMYPNPVKEELTINTLQGGNISIYNVLGSRVKTASTKLKTYKMNVSDLIAGLYVVKINSEDKSFTQKLVVK